MVCWGNEESFIVTATPHAYGFETVSVGGDHACALKKKKVVCWGSNDYNQLTPPEDNLDYMSVEVGTDHTCGILLNGLILISIYSPLTLECSVLCLHVGYVVCWGQDTYKESSGYPPNVRFTQLSLGTGHSCGLTIQRQVMCWGRNKEGQSTPPTTKGKDSNQFFSKVTAGHRHTCGLRDAINSDTVICWGSNYAGESRAMFRSLFVDVTAGAQHSCGVTSKGDIRCWGSNIYGQSLSKTTKNIRGSG